MRLGRLVDASHDLGATRSRLAERARLAELLRELAPEEVPIGVDHLSGALPQGRIGLGGAIFRDLDPGPPAPEPTLERLEVHESAADAATIDEGRAIVES